jgi:hypothetical protein
MKRSKTRRNAITIAEVVIAVAEMTKTGVIQSVDVRTLHAARLSMK